MPRQPVIETATRQNFYCNILIDDVAFIPSNIISCVIREWVFGLLPRIELSILDDGVLFEGLPLTDSSVIEIEISKDKSQEKVLNARFDVIDFNLDVISDNKFSVVNITGILKTENLFWPTRNRYFDDTSKNALGQLALESGLRFKSDIDTNDSMIWIQPNVSNAKMMRHLTSRSRKINDSVFFYGDVDGNLNLTSLKKKIDQNSSIKCRYNLDNYSKESFDNVVDSETLWFNSYDVLNNNGFFNRTNNYGIKFGFFDLEKNKVYEIKNGQSNLADRSFQSVSSNVEYKRFGVLSNNVYGKYFDTLVENEFYRKRFFSNSIALNINSRGNVNLFDLVDVFIPSLVDSGFNDFLSGEYLVGGIVHSLFKNNIYKKQIVCFRDGYNDPNAIERFASL
jgi:hypothetical protein